MTYCLAISVDEGIVFAADSRTNAGVDQVSTYSKLKVFCGSGDRMITLLSAGNLATTQAVVRRINRDIESNTQPNLNSVAHLSEAADYVGEISSRNGRCSACWAAAPGFRPRLTTTADKKHRPATTNSVYWPAV